MRRARSARSACSCSATRRSRSPGPDDLYWVGTTANVLRYVTGPDGSHHVIAQGEQRFRVLQFLDGWEFPVARVQRIEEDPATGPRSRRARSP